MNQVFAISFVAAKMPRDNERRHGAKLKCCFGCPVVALI